jgi:hypothetical protein
MVVQFTHRAPECFLYDETRAVLTEARKLCDVDGLVSIGPAKMATLTGLSKRMAKEPFVGTRRQGVPDHRPSCDDRRLPEAATLPRDGVRADDRS